MSSICVQAPERLDPLIDVKGRIKAASVSTLMKLLNPYLVANGLLEVLDHSASEQELEGIATTVSEVLAIAFEEAGPAMVEMLKSFEEDDPKSRLRNLYNLVRTYDVRKYLLQ